MAFVSVLLGLALVALWGAPAHATPISAILTASNGEGTFDPTIDCPAGDGPSWRYAYSGISAPLAGPFGGTWNSTVEVHDAGGGAAFVPAGTGRLKVSLDRGGDANLEFGGGDCASAPLSLSQDTDGDPVVSGALPAHATGGSGAVRGFSGTGSVGFVLELGPGADNVAQIGISGDFTVLQPNLALGTPTAFWRNLSDYLARRITVIVPVRNTGDSTVSGDAFGVKLTQAKLGGRNPLGGGLPASLGRIDPGETKAATLRYANVARNRTYSLEARIEGTDSLDGALAPVIQSASVKTPLLP
ncbi:MAG: hypothetical protein ACRDKX_03405 [Solirubrobacterales bacterium]